MPEESYFNSDDYQREVATEYEKRIASFSAAEVASVLDYLGFSDIDPESVRLATGGNIHATYMTPEFVIKLNQDQSAPSFFANKIISDRLHDKVPVVNVLAYDNFEKTRFEALVMERARGTVLQHDIFEMQDADQQELFQQVLRVVQQLSQISYPDFGPVNEPDKSYPSYGAYLSFGFQKQIAQIREAKLAEETAIQQFEQYFLDRAGLFDDDKSVFVHTDLHMGNLMHDGSELTAVIDFDHSRRAPVMLELATLLSFLGDPQQFVEGRPEFARYKGQKFLHLVPVLRQELPELFDDPNLLKKLNLISLTASVNFLADNWSEKANAELVRSTLASGLPDSVEEHEQTLYGRTLRMVR